MKPSRAKAADGPSDARNVSAPYGGDPYGDPYGTGQYPAVPQQPGQGGWDTGSYPAQGYETGSYPTGPYPQQPYGDPYGTGQQPAVPQQPGEGGWDTGSYPTADPHRAQQAQSVDPYGGGQATQAPPRTDTVPPQRRPAP